MIFIEQLPLIGPLLANLLPFIVVLGIVVGVHEYGHYIVAKWCGVYSEVFSIGFGPELFGWYDRHGTRWKFCIIPLGGYVRFRGGMSLAEDSASEAGELDKKIGDEQSRRHDGIDDDPSSFPNAALWKRASIAAAGPVANFLLTIMLFAGIALNVGLPSDKPEIGLVVEGTEGSRAGFVEGDVIRAVDGAPIESFGAFTELAVSEPGQLREVEVERDGDVLIVPFTYAPPIRLDRVTQDSAAKEAGIEAGDVVISVNGKKLEHFEELRALIVSSKGASLDMQVERDGVPIDVTLTPRRTEIRNDEGEIEERFLAGILSDPQYGLGSAMQPTSLPGAAKYGMQETGNILGGTLFFLYEMIAGRGDSGDLGGPIRIAEFSGQAAEQGFLALIALTASLSASIGLLNLFPIPVLDGGHLLFYAIEAVRGKPLKQRMQEIVLTIGFAMILTLMVFATWNDIARWL